MDAAPALSPPDTISANLRMVLRGLLAALGAWRVEPVMALVLYRRISGAFGRVERMLARFRAGRLWRLPHRDAGTAQMVRGRPALALPRRFGWLVQVGGSQAAGFGVQLHAVLSAPEMADLLAAFPQAGRILRPLCRALAVELPGVSAAPRRVATAGGRLLRRRPTPRAQPEPFRIPLPRGVLATARKRGFGKDR